MGWDTSHAQPNASAGTWLDGWFTGLLGGDVQSGAGKVCSGAASQPVKGLTVPNDFDDGCGGGSPQTDAAAPTHPGLDIAVTCDMPRNSTKS